MRILSGKHLAETVRFRRRHIRVSQARLAAQTGVSIRLINSLESGDTAISFTRLMRILNAIGLQMHINIADVRELVREPLTVDPWFEAVNGKSARPKPKYKKRTKAEIAAAHQNVMDEVSRQIAELWNLND